MKKINVIAWLITMLMTLVSSPAFATDWGSENVTMQVGETKTLYLPSSVTTKTLKSVTFYSASWNDVEVLSHTNYSVRVKALKATSTPVIVRCDYYYYINNGGYTYQNGGAYDFKVTVKGETAVKPTNISIPSTSSVKVGGSFYFVPSVTPVNATYKLSWNSSNNSIASVNQSGMLTGISAGTASITVTTDNGKSATCKVTVTANDVTSLSLRSSLSLEIGNTYTLIPTITPSDAVTSFTWSTSNSSVATVSQAGVVTAKSAGTANITVTTDNGKTATCKVTVLARSVTSISINSELSLEVGDTYTLTPTITPSDAVTSYTWSSDNSSVVTVSQAGVVTTKSAGTANITVKTDNGKTSTCKVTVSPKAVTSVCINSNLSLEVGETYTLTPAITPFDAVTSYTWSSDNNEVATVSLSGVVTAKSSGTANISVTTDNGKTATCKVMVLPKAVTSVTINASLSLEVGETHTLMPTITPSDAVTSYTWSSDNNSVATVSQAGAITAKSAGTANIIVKTDNGKTATCKVMVLPKSVSSVSINSSLSLEVGETYTLTPTITPFDAVTSYTWSSDNSSVATVSQSGLVTAKEAGTANITVKTDNGKTASCEITVNAPAVVEYDVKFSIYGYENGQILYNGTKLTGSYLDDFGSFKVTEGSNVTLSVLPNQGCKITWLWIDYEDAMDELVNNILTLHNVKKDLSLVVFFDKDDQSDGIVPIPQTKRQTGGKSPIIVDLKGQQIDESKAKNGIYIVNGKKVYIK